MRAMGFSTGALALGDFNKALRWLQDTKATAVELSALRKEELEPLVQALKRIKLARYKFISVHAPSKYEPHEERKIVRLLSNFVRRGWPVVLHPDSVHCWSLWREFGPLLFVENMDNRKPIARNVVELEKIFDLVPDAKLCLDIGHSHQHDRSMNNALAILDRCKSRLGQLHVSEVGSHSQHLRISADTMRDFQKIASRIPVNVPVILETPVVKREIEYELKMAERSLATGSLQRRFYYTRYALLSHLQW